MNEMTGEIIFEVLGQPEGGFSGRALGETLFRRSETLEGLETWVREALRRHFEKGQALGLIRLQS